jgi:hypothetical protein
MCCNDRRQLEMPALVVVLAVLTAASLLAAQKPTIAANPNHVVLAAHNLPALQTALDGATTAGLHVLFASHDGVFLSRIQLPDPPVAYRAIRENSGDRLERALNAAGEQAFRLIPATLTRSEAGTVAVVGRASGVITPYRYRVVASDDGLETNIRDLALKGFSIVGVFTQQSGIVTVLGRPGRMYVVLEAPSGMLTSNTAPPGDGYRTVSALRATTIEKELNKAAREGFRVAGGSLMNVLLEKVTGNPPERSYRVIGAIRGKTLQNEVDEAGRAGFRVVRAAIMANPNSKAETVVVMERVPSSASRFQYGWISASRLAADSSVLDDFSGAGYAPIALWRLGFVPVDEFGNPVGDDAESYFILLERRT